MRPPVAPQPKFRRDFNLLAINISEGMSNPTIEFERGVVLWGKVVEHEDGYRAEHAMVRHLVVPARLVMRASRVDLTQASRCCLQVDPEVIEVETTEHTPEPGMVEALARVYGVDVALGALVTCEDDG